MTATPHSVAPDRDPVQVAGAVHVCLLLGRILFRFGATTQRIQDSIVSLARYLGCKVEMLVSYDALLLTLNDGATFRTRIGSSRGVAGLNLLGLTRVSKLLRGLPHSQTNPDELEQALCAIRDAPPVHNVTGQVLAAGCAGVGFCVVNGGDPASWVCSFVAGAFIFAIRRSLAAWNFNVHLTLFAVALAGSFLSGLIARITQTATPAVALVGPILFLVPGVPMINGGIDVIRDHVTIGIARVGFTVAAVLTLCLAAGLAVRMLPVRVSPPFSPPGVWEIILFSLAGALAAGALAWLNNGDFPMVALCAFGGLTGRFVRALMTLGGLDVITASLIGVLCSTLVVSFVAERLRWPSVVASVIAALPMVPGYFAIAGLHVILSFAAADTADPAQLSVGLHALARALFISIALVAGVIAPLVILQRQTERV
jgi:uncharacterized membrane protein YjjP (DUF1212 family)